MGASSLIKPILRDTWVRVLTGLLVILVMVEPGTFRQAPALVDWHTVNAITGLLILAKMLEMSGYLDVAARRVLEQARSERQLALGLVLFSAVISAWVTNDIALFIVLPLTLSAARMIELPVVRLISFEALAVNAGSCLTPIGNPQNLFIWHRSGQTLWGFCAQMLPLALGLLLIIMAMAWIVFPARSLTAISPRSPRLLPAFLKIAGSLYVVFLIAMQWHWTAWATGLVFLVTLMGARSVLLSTDWALVVTFILVFIDFRALTQWPVLNHWIQAFPLETKKGTFLGAALLSQLVSNVPATIALSGFTHHWRALAYGANVGGFGLAIGSLANLIALRAAPAPGGWASFHLYSVIALGLAIPTGLGLIWYLG